jgi:probable HAF family extracellular repeat protein
MKAKFLGVATALAFFGAGPPAFSDNVHGFVYSDGSYTTLDVPGATDTTAFGINNLGQVVGWYNTPDSSVPGGSSQYGFLYSNGTYTTLNHAAVSINDAGQVVVGYYSVYSNGSYTSLPAIGVNGFQYLGINNSGQIVGSYSGGGFNYSNGSYTTLNYPSASGTGASGINNLGQIVGFYDTGGVNHGFLYSNGSYSSISFPGTGETFLSGT